MPIYLIRHGETALNAARILQPSDTPLSEEGLAQARRLAERLQHQRIDAILSSDLPRAMQTAQAIMNKRPAILTAPLRVQYSSLLQERNLGELRGQPYAAIGIDLLDFKEAPPGGESLMQFDTRVSHAFDYIVNTHRSLSLIDDPVLVVVSHGLVIRRIVEAHLSRTSDQQPPNRLANTSITIFEGAAPYRLTLLNSDSHLFAESSPVQRSAFGG